MARDRLRAKCMEFNVPFRKCSLYTYLSFHKVWCKTNRGVTGTSARTCQNFGAFTGCEAAPERLAPVCSTSGKPSTRLPLGGLVEHALGQKQQNRSKTPEKHAFLEIRFKLTNFFRPQFRAKLSDRNAPLHAARYDNYLSDF